jgi:hypothetical protein
MQNILNFRLNVFTISCRNYSCSIEEFGGQILFLKWVAETQTLITCSDKVP